MFSLFICVIANIVFILFYLQVEPVFYLRVSNKPIQITHVSSISATTTNAAPSLHHKTTIPTIRTTITSTVTTNTTPDPRDSTNTHNLHQHHNHHHHDHHHHQHINNNNNNNNDNINNNNETSRPMWSNIKIVQLDITIVIDIYWLKLLTRHNVINIIS